MKGFKVMKNAHGGKVRRYAEGSDGGVKAEKMEDGSQQWVRGKTRKEKDDTISKYTKSELDKSSKMTGSKDHEKYMESGKKFRSLTEARRENMRKSNMELPFAYAKGGKVHRFAEGGLGSKMGPPDEYETDTFSTRKKPAPSPKKRRTFGEVIENAREYYMGPRKGRKGTYTPPNMDEADAQIRKMIDSGEYKKGGKVKGGKVAKVMREFKSGELHSGKKGPVVKSRKQAIAIALSEAGKSKKG